MISRTMVRQLFIFFAHLGGFGLLIVGAIDSSLFLFLPLGNDLLFVAMTARNHTLMPYYALTAMIGSLIGCISVDLLSRKGGEKGLEKTVPQRYLPFIKKSVQKRAGWALVVASLLPPPFPFSAFVAAAAAFQYPRPRLFMAIAGSRLARFIIEGTLAIVFGRKLLRWARSPVLEYFVIGLILVSILGSVLAVVEWVKKGNGWRFIRKLNERSITVVTEHHYFTFPCLLRGNARRTL